MSYKRPAKRGATKKPQYESRYQAMDAKNEDFAANETEKLFEQRKYYQSAAWHNGASSNKSRDYWRRSGYLYGRVNFQEEPVYLNEYYLKQFRNTSSTIFCLAPVVDAFEEMTQHFKEQKFMSGKQIVGNKSIFRRVEPYSGWTSVNSEYSKYLQDYAAVWIEEYLTLRKEMQIRDFKSFLNLFLTGLTEIGRDAPLTLTGFMRSKYCDPKVTGLTVDIYPINYGNDSVKRAMFNDASFRYYVETVEKFGFILDRNAPWRLTANINYNTTMGRHLSRYGIPYWNPHSNEPDELDKIFTTFYKDVYEDEIPILSHYLAELYNNYVASRPTIAVPTKETCINYRKNSFQKITKIKTIRREPLACFRNRKLDPQSDYLKKYGELFWLRFYYYMRMVESGESINDDILEEEFRKRIVPFYRVHGQKRTVRAINQQLNLSAPTAKRAARDLRRLRFI